MTSQHSILNLHVLWMFLDGLSPGGFAVIRNSYCTSGLLVENHMLQSLK